MGVSGLIFLAASLAGASPQPPRVFVSATDADGLIKAGAQAIDARGTFAKAPYLPGAQVLDWMDLRDGVARTGRLDDLPQIIEALEQAGIQPGRPVVVYGAAAEGWGEEGRIWWTLKHLGHQQVFILDGGIESWVREGLGTSKSPAKRTRSKWTGETQLRLRSNSQEVLDATARKDVLVLDVRTPEEYAGETPYLSPRGGHVPGAVHLQWRDLLQADGRLRADSDLRTLFAARGINSEQRVIAYCTGGVRSAFVVAVLAHIGHADASNYDGSWWDWSMQKALPVSKK